MTYRLVTKSKKLLADTLTPVNIYLKLRDVYAGSILLESSDYHGHENSLSFICCQPTASFQVKDDTIEVRYPDQKRQVINIDQRGQVLQELEKFRDSFQIEAAPSRYPATGLFGYMGYDSIRYFEDIEIGLPSRLIPDVMYRLYRYVVVVDHFSNELTLFDTTHEGKGDEQDLDKLEQLIFSNRFSTFPFRTSEKEASNLKDEDYVSMVEEGIKHCERGDVFQIVLSRRFTSSFTGDEFNVYRALRSINPSPYLFYFDYGSFKIFGSSPEAQIQIKGDEASIYPIAGTFRRSGNDQEDLAIAEKLTADEKENAEHVMLVDLARNDLSRDSHQVKVEVFKEIQYYSHVIHLVSKVVGKLNKDKSALSLVADTFPAGTLSGAPKYMAMKLIDKIENVNRGFYGGAIGFMSFTGDFNHAIMIRTFLSIDNQLICQAGAGVVAKSVPANELNEVNNKLEALRKAIVLAENLK